jgi:LL-diaminopimelate aminotransferase
VVGNAAALDALAQVKSNFDSGLFRPVQEAAASALTGDEDWAAKRNALYEKRLDILVKTLHQIGFQAQLPLATFYIWARLPERFCSAAGDESNGPAESAAERFALSLLRHTGVAVAPGSFFGAEGECYLRFSATLPTERIAEAAHRLLSFAGDQ